ncbi:kita-kyushu lung cancer antigen 1 [Loxodonta africana]|uniref:kita-kyushu lung cancer antigen 1 n=1 Tax=Loxodonta africana TaxID=9785 RepID=UPI0002235219|nr:kita-kyushu lung cancer antigen 1 [Loxodonta africana]XP_049727386.1 kita-kyushu lung cancer antigen 1 [Elephas maximus indicus]
MTIFFLLMSGVLFALAFVFWKKRRQRNIGKMSSNLTALARARPTSPGSSNSNTEKSLSVNRLSLDILHNNFPHSIAMQKRILVNLRIVEYKLAELEHFLVTKGLNGALVNRKSTEKHT